MVSGMKDFANCYKILQEQHYKYFSRLVFKANQILWLLKEFLIKMKIVKESVIKA